MPLRNVPITYTIDQQRQEINALAGDVNDIDSTFDERVDDRVSALVSGGVGIATAYNDASGSLDISLAFNEFSTSAILEGTNYYYTDARANAAIDARVNQNFVNNLNITNLGPQDSITLQLGQTTKYLTPLNYKNVDWDTAYSWGDHAAAGYLTAYVETDTLDSVTDRNPTTVNTITVGALKTNSIQSKLSGDTLAITAGKVSFTNDISVGTYSTGLANDYGVNLEDDGILTINHPPDAGGLYLKDSGTTNFFIDRSGKINGAVNFVTSDGVAGQSLTTDGNGQLVWGEGGGANVNISDGLPSSAVNGDLWWESDTGRLKVYYDNGLNPAVWVDASPPLEASVPNTNVRNNVGAVSATWNTTGTVFADTSGDFTAAVLVSSFEKIRVRLLFGRLSGTAGVDGWLVLERNVGGTPTEIARVYNDADLDQPVYFEFIDTHGQTSGTSVTYQVRLELTVAGNRSTGGTATSQISIEEV
jgi:hypothetical protein